MARLTLLDDQPNRAPGTSDVLRVRLDLGVPCTGSVRLDLIAIFSRIRIGSRGILGAGGDIYLASGGGRITVNLDGFRVAQLTPSESTPVANQVKVSAGDNAAANLSPKLGIPGYATLEGIGVSLGNSQTVERTATFESREVTLQSNDNVDSVEWIIDSVTLASRRSMIANRSLFAELVPTAAGQLPNSATGEVSYSALKVAIYDDDGKALESVASVAVVMFLVRNGLASMRTQRAARKASFKVDFHA